ncbi:AAA family ATPase, partial [Candidatus Micrarchaeota archaeon CG11_big_fil_rev_8_21_14_0_20_47_5]
MAAKKETDEGLKNEFEQFFSFIMQKEVSKLVLSYPAQKSLVVSYPLLEKFNSDLADALVKNPDELIEAAEEALIDMNVSMPGSQFEPHVRFCDLPNKELLVQDIGSRHIEKLIAVKGVITKRTEIMHKVRIALYKCLMCDAAFKIPMTKKAQPPQICESCKRRALKLVEEDSYFVDIQKAEMQDLLERITGGAPSARVSLFLEDDLVNTLTPGDNVEISAVMRIMPMLPSKGKPASRSQTYVKYLDVLHIAKTQKDFEELEISGEDEQRIRELSRDPRLYTRLIKSLAPAIYGHDEVKEGILLQLFGGTKNKVMAGGGKIRDDMHILLIGDPGAAKTRFLQNVDMLAPKSIYVSGKSASGVGLTASAERDELGEGGWTLKAGALVLASGGMCAIDEFDKMEESERATMHEVMESQTISIAKAGMVAKFKAKTAILAAANPKMGRFDLTKMLGEQFDIPPTLLSRFDLVFPILDVMDEDKDTKLAHHILTMHKRAAQIEKGTGDEQAEAADPDLLEPKFIRKYIALARREIRPVLTSEAESKLQDYYVQMRNQGRRAGGGAVPITPRQIEGLIRMSEASAKIRLSNTVDNEDADRAIKLMTWVLEKMYVDR